jgi:hypothetical protein
MPEAGKIKGPSLLDRARAYIEANGGNRLLLAIGLLGSVQLIYLLGLVGSWTENREIALLTLRTEVEAMEALVNQDDLSDTVTQARQTLAGAEARLHAAPTAGLVSADIQAFLRSAGDRTGMSNLQLAVNVEDTTRADLARFTIDLTGVETTPGAFAAFLAEVRAGKAAFAVKDFVWDARMLRVRAKLETLALIAEEPPPP